MSRLAKIVLYLFLANIHSSLLVSQVTYDGNIMGNSKLTTTMTDLPLAVPVGSNKCIVVIVVPVDTLKLDSVKYGEFSLTRFGQYNADMTCSNAIGHDLVTVWIGLLGDTDINLNENVVIFPDSTELSYFFPTIALSFSGVDQLSPIDSPPIFNCRKNDLFSFSSDSTKIEVPSEPGDLVWDYMNTALGPSEIKVLNDNQVLLLSIGNEFIYSCSLNRTNDTIQEMAWKMNFPTTNNIGTNHIGFNMNKANPPFVSIPTLSEWSIILMTLTLMLLGHIGVRNVKPNSAKL